MDAKRENKPKAKITRKALLLGVGLDNQDGQKRVTVGKNFLLTGGSKPTHEFMQEKAIKVNEELDRRKKRLEEVEPEEFLEIAERVKLNEQP